MNVGKLCGEAFVIGATEGTTARQAAKRMAEEQVGMLLVVGRDGRLAGVLTDRDLVVRVMAAGKDADGTKLLDIMSTPPKTVTRMTDVFVAAQLMREASVRRLAVIDDEGRAVGVVSLDDLLALSSEVFEDLASVVADARASARKT